MAKQNFKVHLCDGQKFGLFNMAALKKKSKIKPATVWLEQEKFCLLVCSVLNSDL